MQCCGDHACPPEGCRQELQPKAVDSSGWVRDREPSPLAHELTQLVQGPGGRPVGPDLAATARRAVRGAEQPLTPQVRGMLEPRLGEDFGDVRVHSDGPSTRAAGADAYTIGSDIVFAPGRYRPDSAPGMRLLTHELTHVVQQRRGVTGAQADRPGSPDRDPLEQEAEQVADTLPVGPAGPMHRPPDGALASTRGGRSAYAPEVRGHPLQSRIEAHEAVHRAQFAAAGRRPTADVDRLEQEAWRGSDRLLQGLAFDPQWAAPAGVELTFQPSPSGRCPGGCHEPSSPTDPAFNWRQIKFPDFSKLPKVKVKTPEEILAEQPKSIAEEVGRFEQSIMAQRALLFQQLEKEQAGGAATTPFGFPKGPESTIYQGLLPPDLRQRYGAATAATAAIEAGIKAKDITLETQDESRAAIRAFYLALEELGRAVGVADAKRVEQFRIDQEWWDHSRRRAAPCPNCHAPVEESPFKPKPPMLSHTPDELAALMPASMARLSAAQTTDEWQQVLRDFGRWVDGMDNLLETMLTRWYPGAGGMGYLKQQKAQLEQFQQANPMAIPIPAVFYPENRFVDAEDQPDPNVRIQVAESIPWRFYLYHTGVSSQGAVAGEWVLVDMTSPHTFRDTHPASDLDAMMVKATKFKWDPPRDLFDKLNHKLHFPKGRLYWVNPSGTVQNMEMTEPRTISDWLGIIGMTLGAIALIAGIIVTGGALAGVAVPALVGEIGLATGIAAAGFGIASTLTERAERRKYGLWTAEDEQRAYLSIALDIIGALAMGLGRLAVAAQTGARALQTGARVSAVTRALATINGRYLFVISRSANFMKRAGLAADIVQLGTATSDFIKAFNAIRSQPGLSDADRERALIKLISTGLLTGTLLTISIRGGIKEEISGRTVRVSDVDPEGHLLADPQAGGVPHAAAPAPRVVPGQPELPAAPARPGWSREKAPPQVDPNLPEGRVEVRVLRDEAGRIIDAHTFHHAGADPESIKIHDDIATLVRNEGEQLRELLHQQRRAFGGAAPPLELQLELKKLFDEVAAAEKRLAGGGLSKARADDVRHKLILLQNEIANVRSALADPTLRGAYPAGVIGVPVKPTALPRRGKGGRLEKPPKFPDPPDGYAYYLRDDGTWDIRPRADVGGPRRFTVEYEDGRPVATNRAYVDSEFAGRKLTPQRKAELEAMGYVFQANDVVRRPAGHAEAGKPRMVPIEIDPSGRIQIVTGAESLAEMQTRLRGALNKVQARKLEGLEAKAPADAKVVLVEGVYDTGFSWRQILTPQKRAQLRAALKAEKLADAEIDRLIDGLTGKSGTVKVVMGTEPVRAAHQYRTGYAEAHGAPKPGVEVHHGDPLYLGGGHDPALLFGLKAGPHDALHAFFDQLTLPSGKFRNTPLQPTRLQTAVRGELRPAAAVVTADGSVSYTILGGG
jgi:hypothetical protein